MNSTTTNARTEQLEIDASAKWPLLVFFGSAILWLLVGGALQLIVHDTRFEFFDTYRGTRNPPRFIYGSRSSASAVVLEAADTTSRRADWVSIAAAAAPAPVAKPVEPAAAPSKAPEKSDDIERRLETLKRLRDKNLISEDEYQQKRKELLQLL